MQRTPPKSICSSESDIYTTSERDEKPKPQEREDKPKQPNPKKKYKRTRGSDEEETSPHWITFKEEVMAALKKITSDVEEVKAQNNVIQETNQELSKSITFLAGKYDELQQAVIDLRKERNDNLSYIKALENRVEDMQRSTKLSTIEIRNVPTKATENQDELANIVQKTCQVLSVDLQRSDLKDVFRVSTKSSKNTILAEFTSVLMKNRVIQNAKQYNKQNKGNKLNTSVIGIPGNHTPIYISESLTPKNKRLYYLAREFAKSQNYTYCWTSYGKVFLRKTEGTPHIVLREECELAALKDKTS